MATIPNFYAPIHCEVPPGDVPTAIPELSQRGVTWATKDTITHLIIPIIVIPLLFWLVKLTRNWLRSRDIVIEAGRRIRAALPSNRGASAPSVELSNLESGATAPPPLPDEGNMPRLPPAALVSPVGSLVNLAPS